MYLHVPTVEVIRKIQDVRFEKSSLLVGKRHRLVLFFSHFDERRVNTRNLRISERNIYRRIPERDCALRTRFNNADVRIHTKISIEIRNLPPLIRVNNAEAPLKAPNRTHVPLRQFEIEHRDIFLYPFGVGAFRDNDRISLYSPPQQYLCGGFPVRTCYAADDFLVNQSRGHFLVAGTRERRVRGHDHAEPPTEVEQARLLQIRMHLYLIDGGLKSRGGE